MQTIHMEGTNGSTTHSLSISFCFTRPYFSAKFALHSQSENKLLTITIKEPEYDCDKVFNFQAKTALFVR